MLHQTLLPGKVVSLDHGSYIDRERTAILMNTGKLVSLFKQRLRHLVVTIVRKRRLVVALIGMVIGLGLLDRTFPLKFTKGFSKQILASDGTLLHAFLSDDEKWRLYTRSEEITPLLRETLIFKEDKYFRFHPGVNPFAVLRAFFSNLVYSRRTSGASTITMQVVRLLEPRPRTYGSKFVELFRAVQLELHYSKDEILQMYLNLVPYGGNIEGIKAASLMYFGKTPQLLSLGEIVTLSIIPNRPSSLRPGRNNIKLLSERNKWLTRLAEDDLFERRVVGDALQEPLEIKRNALPRSAPHLSALLRRQFPDQDRITSYLKVRSQSLVEELVKAYVNGLKGQSIHNAAVLVVNNETMGVEAYLGSADFNNPFDGGQVDGIRAVRSPGSTLKPLLYAKAFDAGLLTPQTIVNDVPINFGGYEPENFDTRFNGPVSVQFALANSLNIPAVKVLQDLKVSQLIKTMKSAGFHTVGQQEKDLGLSMILGGCGVTLEELTRLFACFANEGVWSGLRYTMPDLKYGIKKDTFRLFSKEASFLTAEVLKMVSRPDFPLNFESTYHLPRIAWKTGTSYGKRDAWSIGYNRRYTVGIWVGNFSGEGVPELSGANTATPLLFRIFNSLDYNSTKGWYQAPANLLLRKICPLSGDIPSDFCEHQALGNYIAGISPNRKCKHMRYVFTDKASKISYCTYCLPSGGYERILYPNLAPELVAFYEQKKIPYQRIPPHNPNCDRVFADAPPKIVSLNEGGEYYIRTDEPQQLQLQAHAANDVSVLYWYLNDRLVGKSSPAEQLFISPRVGKIKVSCTDDKGRNTNIWITVKKM